MTNSNQFTFQFLHEFSYLKHTGLFSSSMQITELEIKNKLKKSTGKQRAAPSRQGRQEPRSPLLKQI